MATVTYTFVGICSGGDHLTLDVALNGANIGRFVYDLDNDIRPPLSALSTEDRRFTALNILKLKGAGLTRAQILSAAQSGVTVTI